MTFEKWLTNTYDHNTLADMVNYGCQHGIGGMIYYNQLRPIYAEYAWDIHRIISEYCQASGEEYPKNIAEALGDYNSFVSRCVWFAAEWVAAEVTKGEYNEEEEGEEEYPTDESRSYGPHYRGHAS